MTLQNGVATHFQASPLISMRTELLASSQSCRSVDADAWCKWALTFGHQSTKKFKQECIPVGCVPPAHWPYLIEKTTHAPPRATTHAPPGATMHTPPGATTYAPWSNHACPPGATTHAPPRSNHTPAREQPCMPPQEQPCMPPHEQPHLPPKQPHTPLQATTHAPPVDRQTPVKT